MPTDIPLFEDLQSVYGQDTAAVEARFADIKNEFQRLFGAPPDLYARSPGRVNLIGEHIDYEGYEVLPMAITLDAVVAVKVGGGKLQLANLDSQKYPATEFSADPKQAVDTSKHSWGNYFLAAYKGVYEYLEAKGIEVPEPQGLQLLVHSIVPPAGGLSSSSALVCASSLAVLGALGVRPPQADVADFTCKCERYVGTQSGGMDQAISIMGQPGLAKLVYFNPVKTEDVQLPEGAAFVVANSLSQSHKFVTATSRYNLRVVECQLAAALLSKLLGATAEDARKVVTLREVEPAIAAKHGDGPEGKAAAVEALLKKGGYTAEELESELAVPLRVIFCDNQHSLAVLEDSEMLQRPFMLRERALHVYSEAARVHAFRDVCAGKGDAATKLAALGALMNSSHTSCKDLYNCSAQELDELVAVARDNNVLGARLTGAGWGGCIVALVHEDAALSFIDKVKDQYYAKRVEQNLVTAEGLGTAIFATKPSAGAAIIKLA